MPHATSLDTSPAPPAATSLSRPSAAGRLRRGTQQRGPQRPASAPALRSHVTPALGSVLALTADWVLSPAEECALLGAANSETFLAWRSSRAPLPADVVTRAALLLDLTQALRSPRIRLGAPEGEWLRTPRSDAPFHGRSPLALMLAGGVAGMAHVRCYLDLIARTRPVAKRSRRTRERPVSAA